MRSIVLALFLLSSQVSFSQEVVFSRSNINAGNLFSLAVSFVPQNNADFNRFAFFPHETVQSQQPYVSPVRTLMANDFFFNGPPLASSLGTEVIMLGQTVTNSFNLLGIKGNMRYVFDTNGMLIDHQTSFQFRKRNKKQPRSKLLREIIK